MYIVTTMSLDELGSLIREKRVSLDNGQLIFGQSEEAIDQYFKDRIGYNGYVIGLRGRINKASAEVFKQLDRGVSTGDKVILEAEIDEDDMIRYQVDGVTSAASALYYGMSVGDIHEQLDAARLYTSDGNGVEVLCVPFIKSSARVRVTSLVEDDINFNVEGITFVKLKGGQ